MRLRWWRQETPEGEITIVASTSGVRAIGLPGEDLPDYLGAVEPGRVDDIAAALDAWFRGTGDTAEVPLDLDPAIHGFRREVLEVLHREVGWGETVSYGELADMVGHPGAARAVGQVMASNPIPFMIPCHRVIASDGRIGGYGGMRGGVAWVDIKRELLAREGVHPPG